MMPGIGVEISGYRIDGLLGRGGMGVVYEATQLSLGRKVALKMLAPLLAGDLVLRARFRREALLQATLDHPHVVDVYEAGVAEQGLFIAMRLVRGATLRAKIREGRLTPELTMCILAPIAEALDDAHDAGLVHRDVKPENVLVSLRNHAYLADFGLVHSDRDARLTEPGKLLGTPGYLAPELRCGGQPTPASDVYAFSAMLHECFAVSRALAPRLTAVLARGLALSPADRPSRVRDLIRETRRALAAPPRRPPVAPLHEPPIPVTSGRVPADHGPARWRRIAAQSAGSVLAVAAVLVALAFAAGVDLRPATTHRFDAELDPPMVNVISHAEFLRERRIGGGAVDPGALRAHGAAIESNLKLQGQERRVQIGCSVRDLNDARAMGVVLIEMTLSGETSTVTVPCWVPAALIPGHRYRAIVRVWTRSTGASPVATGSADFTAFSRR